MGDAGPWRRYGWLLVVLVVPLLFLVSYPHLDEPPPVAPPDEEDRPAPSKPAPADVSRSDQAGRIEGRVTRGGKGCPAELTLRLFPRHGGKETRHTSADETGAFAFTSVPAGEHEVAAVAPDGVRAPRIVRLRAPLTEAHIEIALPSGPHSIRGRAVYADGRPFRGIVQVRPKSHANRVAVETAEDGGFLLPGLDPCTVRLEFRIEGRFRTSGPTVKVPTDEEFHVVVDDGAREVKGRVLSLGTDSPIEGARVTVVGWTPARRMVTTITTTESDGRFVTRVPVEEDRVGTIEVEAEGHWVAMLEGVEWREEFTIRLDKASRLIVRVVSAEDGRPVPNVPVNAEYAWIPDTTESEQRLSDAEGKAVFTKIAGRTASIDARGNGWRMDHTQVPEETWFVFVSPGESREIEIPVRRTALLRVSVATASGEPPAQFRLEWSIGGSSTSAGSYRGTTKVVIPDLLPGPFSIHAKSGGLEGTEVRGTLAAAEAREVSLTLPEGANVEVEVRAADTGEPVSKAQVILGNSRLQGWTDDQGLIRLGPFRPERMSLYVTRPGFVTARSKHAFADDESTRIEVLLERGQSISGTALLPDGAPAAGARVSWYGGRHQRQSAQVAPDGTFTLFGLPPGDLRIHAVRDEPDGRRFRGGRTARAGETGIEVRLKPDERRERRKIALIVTDPQGVPVPRADYLFFALDDEGEHLQEDLGVVVEGRAEISVITRASEVQVLVSGARRPTSAPLPLGSKVIGPFPATRETVEIVLPAERILTGRVIGPNGRGLPRVLVEAAVAVGEENESHNLYPLSAFSGPDGEFEMRGLGAETVEIYCYPPDELAQARPVYSGAGTSEVVLQLDSLVEASVTVRDLSGRPVADAEVIADLAAGLGVRETDNWGPPQGYETTDENGRVRFDELVRNGPYRLLVHPPLDFGAVRIDDWRPGDRDVTVPAGLDISGRILAADGSPYTGSAGRLWAWGRARGWAYVDHSGNGEFGTSGFGAGRVALVFLPADADPWEEPEVEPEKLRRPLQWVDAGDDEVVFRIPGE